MLLSLASDPAIKTASTVARSSESRSTFSSQSSKSASEAAGSKREGPRALESAITCRCGR